MFWNTTLLPDGAMLWLVNADGAPPPPVVKSIHRGILACQVWLAAGRLVVAILDGEVGTGWGTLHRLCNMRNDIVREERGYIAPESEIHFDLHNSELSGVVF